MGASSTTRQRRPWVTALAACAALAAVAIGAPPKARYELPADEPDSQPNRVSTRADVLRAKRAYLIEAPEEPEPLEDAPPAAPNTEAPQLAIQTDEAASPTEPATARDTSRKNCSELGWATQVTEHTHTCIRLVPIATLLSHSAVPRSCCGCKHGRVLVVVVCRERGGVHIT
jgi:hypothetical protein